MFKKELELRPKRDSFRSSLENAADQFIQRRDGKTDIVAGYPWFGVWGRDAFISLPGLTLSTGKYDLAKAILDTMSKRLNGPLFPNVGTDNQAAFNSIDAPLWYFWAIQQYCYITGNIEEVWKSYGKKMQTVLEGYKNGSEFNIRMQENGLISGGIQGKALTWMDAIAGGKAVTPRIGMPVEINALWYNAVKFYMELSEKMNKKPEVKKWAEIAEKIESSFTQTFWDENKAYLADYVNGEYKNWDIRPNMIFAASLPYSPVSDYIKAAVVKKVKEELLTVRGLRTLSPSHPDYEGIYEGDQNTRDKAYHQGTVWPWLFGHYAEAYLRIRKKTGIVKMEWYLEQFEQTIYEHGIGTISEIYDGDPPHTPRGAISQAWSVAEILRVMDIIEKVKKEK
jgi:predicted glycogen debranching enzyme